VQSPDFNSYSCEVQYNRSMSRVTVCVIAIVLATWARPVAAGQITIKVVNGHTGKPLKATTVDIWFGRKASPPPTQVTTTDDGNSLLPFPDSIETILIAGQGVGDCRTGNLKSYIEGNVYRVQDILQRGIVAQNACGKTRSKATTLLGKDVWLLTGEESR
jgi:hypothetical protein